jgi:hypothetical protein
VSTASRWRSDTHASRQHKKRRGLRLTHGERRAYYLRQGKRWLLQRLVHTRERGPSSHGLDKSRDLHYISLYQSLGTLDSRLSLNDLVHAVEKTCTVTGGTDATPQK